MRVAWRLLRARSRPALALVVAALSLVALRACFIEIQEPRSIQDDASSGSSGEGGSAGSVGGTGGIGAAGSGGASGGGIGGTCSADCGVPCSACGNGGNAERACSDAGTCTIVKCADNFVDCDGDVANGCEAEFGPFANGLGLGEATVDGGTAWIIPHLTSPPSVDTPDSGVPGVTLSGWNEAKSIRLNAVCGIQCKSSTDPGELSGVPIHNSGSQPSDAELKAYFRVGWHGESLFVLALVQDDELVRDPSNTSAFPAAERQDSIEVFLDSLDVGLDGYQDDDYHLFIGAVDGTMFDPQHPTRSTDNIINVTRHTVGSCYFIQAEFKSNSVDPSPSSRAQYGFTIGVNDWDFSPGGTARRAYQVLWQSPGAQYGYKVTLFPRVQLQQ